MPVAVRVYLGKRAEAKREEAVARWRGTSGEERNEKEENVELA